MKESYVNMPDLAFVDLETGGLDPHNDVILQVAVLRLRHVDVMCDDIRVVQKLNVYIMPFDPESVHAKAAEINGFSVYEWERRNAVDIFEAWPDICKILDGTILVGQNATFDYRFLKTAEKDCGGPRLNLADYHLVDLSSIAHVLRCAGRIPDVSTDTIAQHYGIKPRTGIHTAYKDVKLAVQNYRGLMSEITLHG